MIETSIMKNKIFMVLLMVLFSPIVGATSLPRDAVCNSIDSCSPLAQKNNAEAQRWLGYIYEKGIGVPKSYEQEFSWYKKAALQNDFYAQMQLGFMYENGIWVSENKKAADEWYQKAMEQKAAIANVIKQANEYQDDKIYANILGFMYGNGMGVTRDYKLAFDWYKKAAKLGDVDSQATLGYLYSIGKGVQKDELQSFAWFKKAAEQGNANAQSVVAYEYFKGEVVGAKNYKLAFVWAQKAAKQGDESAQRFLGHIYLSNQVVSFSFVQGYAWFCTGTTQNYYASLSDIDKRNTLIYIKGMYSVMTNAEKKEADKWLQEYREKYLLPYHQDYQEPIELCKGG